MAETVNECLARREEDKAIQMICELEDALKWRDAEWYDWIFIHNAAFRYCKHFFSTILKNERLVVFINRNNITMYIMIIERIMDFN